MRLFRPNVAHYCHEDTKAGLPREYFTSGISPFFWPAERIIRMNDLAKEGIQRAIFHPKRFLFYVFIFRPHVMMTIGYLHLIHLHPEPFPSPFIIRSLVTTGLLDPTYLYLPIKPEPTVDFYFTLYLRFINVSE